MDTPSQKLAAKIIERLIHEDLITPTDGERMSAKLADGKLQPEDWRLPLELKEQKDHESQEEARA
jgi:hypothetical protein